MKSNYLSLLCAVLVIAVTVNTYSQSDKPSFRVVISTVSGSGEKGTAAKDSFKVGEEVQIKVEITNLSNKVINIPKGIGFSRPTLFHNGQLVSYREEVSKQFRKGEGGSITGMLFPKPNESQSEILDLNDYYEPLEPGQYQLSLERRFFKVNDNAIKIQSNAVTFEVVSCDKKWKAKSSLKNRTKKGVMFNHAFCFADCFSKLV
jgi:hypothetical protein